MPNVKHIVYSPQTADILATVYYVSTAPLFYTLSNLLKVRR